MWGELQLLSWLFRMVFTHYWRWPIVVDFCVIWSLVNSCLIGKHTTCSYFYITHLRFFYKVGQSNLFYNSFQRENSNHTTSSYCYIAHGRFSNKNRSFLPIFIIHFKEKTGLLSQIEKKKTNNRQLSHLYDIEGNLYHSSLFKDHKTGLT